LGATAILLVGPLGPALTSRPAGGANITCLSAKRRRRERMSVGSIKNSFRTAISRQKPKTNSGLIGASYLVRICGLRLRPKGPRGTALRDEGLGSEKRGLGPVQKCCRFSPSVVSAMHGEKRDGRSNADAVVQERRAGGGWYSLADATALSRKVDVEVERDIARAVLAGGVILEHSRGRLAAR
jgi:hypothetical protein